MALIAPMHHNKPNITYLFLNVEIVVTDMVYSHKSSHVIGLIHILIHGTNISTVHISHRTYTLHNLTSCRGDTADSGLRAHRATS